MPPLPTPHSSARWLEYGRADHEGIWNATMIIVSKGHLLAEDQTKNYTRSHVLCVFCLCHLRLRAPPHIQDTRAGVGEQYSRLSRTEQHQAPYSRSHQRSSTIRATRTPFFHSRDMSALGVVEGERYTCGPGYSLSHATTSPTLHQGIGGGDQDSGIGLIVDRVIKCDMYSNVAVLWR